MPINDPGGHYASGGAVNQGGPAGNSGGGGSGGSNVRSAYSGSRGYRPGASMVFGPPLRMGLSADQYEAFNNPGTWNYTDNPQIGQSLNYSVGGVGPRGAGGANSGQGGMGAGRRVGLVRALQGGGITGLRGIRID